jgi:nucleotide-binding universal stress UspA family protein
MISLVVGHSRDPASQEALRVAKDLARRLDARLHVVHGITLRDYPIDPEAADWDEQAAWTLAKQREQVQITLAACPQAWTYDVARGDPVRLISATAEEDDALMIIVGTRGQGLGPTIERLFGYSVSHGLIRRQHRPVLIVRAPESRSPRARRAIRAVEGTRMNHGGVRGKDTPRSAVVPLSLPWHRKRVEKV